MGEFIGPHAEKRKKDPKSYGPRLITDKEAKEILNSIKIKVEEQEEAEAASAKKPITGDPTNLLTAGTTTIARPKVKDILTDTGIT